MENNVQVAVPSNMHLNECNEYKSKNVYLARQILVAIGPFLITLIRAFGTGFSATFIPALQSANSTIPVSVHQEAWIASLAIIPVPVGGFISMCFMERYGRRMANMVVCPMITLSWLVIYFAETMDIILLGRALEGIASGFTAPPTTVFVAESTSPKYRGSFLAAFFVNASLGAFIIHIIGTYFDWRTTALIAAISPILPLLLMFFVPESPSWLLLKGNVDKARSAFHWCRGFTKQAEDELSKMIENVAKENETNSLRNQLKLAPTAMFLKPLSITVILYLTVTWSGMQTIIFYSVQFAEKTFPDLDKYVSTLIMDAVRVIAAVVSCFIVKYLKRRPYLLVTGLGSGLSLYIISLLLFLSDSYYIAPIIVLLLMLLYISLTTAGLMCIAHVVGGEIYPLQVRSLGSATCNTIRSLLLFAVVQASPYMFKTITMAGTYLVYGSACFVGGIVLFFVLPETKGKTLLQIESNFKKSNRMSM